LSTAIYVSDNKIRAGTRQQKGAVMEVTVEQFQALQNEIKELTSEVHQLQRQATSRRGPEGARGLQGVPGERGPVGPAGTVSREQAIAMFREVANELFKDEVSERFIGEVVSRVFSEISSRLKKGSKS
jgi:hypothetical protein